MQLWTEYEGITIDGAFPLKKLLLPEGRSAFFSTANEKGETAMMRLIECHFDEEEILARWRGVEAMGHPNFLKLDRFGELTLDESTCVYAVFERVDANLAQVIERGRLNFADAVQLASSLVSALGMLHAQGFVHEHMEARNVFAVGEEVKLRSDCIREAPEGEAGLEAKRRDVRDLAVILLQALTQEKTLEAAARRPALPAPFDEVVRNGITGAWGLKQIEISLQSAQRPVRPRAATIPNSTQATVEQVAAVAGAKASAPAGKPGDVPTAKPFETKTPFETKMTSTAVPPLRFSGRAETWREHDLRQKIRWIGTAVLSVVGVVLLWFLTMHSSSDKHSGAVNAASITPTVKVAKAAPHSGTAAVRGASPVTSGKPSAANGQGAGAKEQWRVIAFTYNHEDQAKQKAGSLAQKRPDLHPEVFTPTGHAPYLVTVGGVLERDAAYSLARRSRTTGLPRDTYAQNY